MPTWVWITLTAIGIVYIAGLIYSIAIGKRVQNKKFDENVNSVTAKHPVLANPILLGYIFFTIAILVLIAIFYGNY
jgi:hypothetical protein